MLVHHGMLAKSGNVGSVDVSLINSFSLKQFAYMNGG